MKVDINSTFANYNHLVIYVMNKVMNKLPND